MAAWFMLSVLPRLLNMNMCSGFTSCMAEMRSSEVHAVPSITWITAVSTMLLEVCTRIGCTAGESHCNCQRHKLELQHRLNATPVTARPGGKVACNVPHAQADMVCGTTPMLMLASYSQS